MHKMYGLPHRGVLYRHAKHDTWTDGSQFSPRSCHGKAAAAEGKAQARAHTHTQRFLLHNYFCDDVRFYLWQIVMWTRREACRACWLTVCLLTVYILLLEQQLKWVFGCIVLSTLTDKSKCNKSTVWPISFSLESGIWTPYHPM